MVEGRKRAVSLRVSDADMRKVKKLATRLGARDSDVIRFALKTMLTRLAPLCDPNVRGRGLLPVFMDTGVELIRHFDIDGGRLDDIVNAGVTKGQEIDAQDLHLIAMVGLQQSYTNVALGSLHKPGHQRRALDIDDPVNSRLRSYLVSKYVTPRTVANEDEGPA